MHLNMCTGVIVLVCCSDHVYPLLTRVWMCFFFIHVHFPCRAERQGAAANHHSPRVIKPSLPHPLLCLHYTAVKSGAQMCVFVSAGEHLHLRTPLHIKKKTHFLCKF